MLLGCDPNLRKSRSRPLSAVLRSASLALSFALTAVGVAAKPLAFDFKDPKEISAVSLTLDSPLEPIVGWAKGISGMIAFDPLNPERSTGAVSVDVDSVKFANDGYTATAQNYALNAKKWPRLTLVVRKVERMKKVTATRYTGVVLADFTCRGITKPKRLVVTADYFPDRAAERTNGQFAGDLLVLRTNFSVSRKEHGISEGIPDTLVGDSVEVGVRVVGIHYTAKTAAPGSATPPPTKAVPAASPPSRQALDVPLPRIGGGAPLSLNGVRAGKKLVVFFLNEQCGVTVFYKDRLRRLERDFASKGFAFVAVHAGRRPHPERAIQLPERAYLSMPFLDDADGALMRRFGIGQSLTFAVLKSDASLAYLGGFDDNVDPARVRRAPLRDVLRALAAGRPVRVSRFRAIGCAILPVVSAP